jgi:hypothetical protein
VLEDDDDVVLLDDAVVDDGTYADVLEDVVT